MKDLVLVTGGAGFIGSHTVDALIERGYRVRILDSLQPRVHPDGMPEWVNPAAEFVQGDVSDYATMQQALKGVTFVLHLAAYQDYLPDFSTFIHTNTESAALLLELSINSPVRKIVFASSQAVCGEGLYVCPCCAGRLAGTSCPMGFGPAPVLINQMVHADAIHIPPPRPLAQLEAAGWEVRCPTCHAEMLPGLIPEHVVSPGTAYGISKYAIELLAQTLGRKYDLPTVCMRYTYVQGPRNSLYNAYSGAARRFAMRLSRGEMPTVYEDGQQLRDFVNVRDVARANWMALEYDTADWEVFQVGGGRAITVLRLAELMAKEFGYTGEIRPGGEFRVGDTRHTVSDIFHIMSLTGWEPTIPVEESVREYAAWFRSHAGVTYEDVSADRELRQNGALRTVKGDERAVLTALQEADSEMTRRERCMGRFPTDP